MTSSSWTHPAQRHTFMLRYCAKDPETSLEHTDTNPGRQRRSKLDSKHTQASHWLLACKPKAVLQLSAL